MSEDNSPVKDLHLSWHDCHEDSETLAHTLKEMGAWKGIIAITKGGMIPAALVARVLDIKLIDTFCISTYDHQDQRAAEILKTFKDENGGEGWLVIDDLADSGDTAKIIREHLPKTHIATVYAKPAGLPDVDTYVRDIPQDTWIHFPWESDAKCVEDLRQAG